MEKKKRMFQGLTEHATENFIELQNELGSDFDRVEGLIPGITFENEIGLYNWPLQVKRWLWRDKYYKGLAAYCKAFLPKRVLEIGTCTGASAVCLAKFSEHVVTSDVTDWSVADKAIFGERVTFRKCEQPTDALELGFADFDLVFVDIDHSGLKSAEVVSQSYAQIDRQALHRAVDRMNRSGVSKLPFVFLG